MPKRVIDPVLEGPIRLRLLEGADLPLTLSWRNQENIRRWFFHSDRISPEQHQSWFMRYQDCDDDFVFVIEELPGSRPVGQVSLYHVDWAEQKAEFGRLMIGEASAAGKGLARVATRAALKIAFETFSLNEVYLEVFEENQRARSIYDRTGFQVEKNINQVVHMKISALSFAARTAINQRES
jgi:RimJ/RimL family protein N-acetyltransferase